VVECGTVNVRNGEEDLDLGFKNPPSRLGGPDYGCGSSSRPIIIIFCLFLQLITLKHSFCNSNYLSIHHIIIVRVSLAKLFENGLFFFSFFFLSGCFNNC
jgi:hypothetical protein